VVRSDLPRGIQAAQIVHAAGESAPGNLPVGTYAVVLRATQEELERFETVLILNGVDHCAIRENDAPYSGELTAIGLAPAPKSHYRRWTRNFKLL